MPYYPRARAPEKSLSFMNARPKLKPYVIPRRSATSSTPATQNISPLTAVNHSSLITIAPSQIPTAATKDAGTQTITREKNLDPINFARLYINTQMEGDNVEEKRRLFYEDETLNENLRRAYRKFVEDHNNTDGKSKLTKVDRKYHLLDRSLRSKILEMSSNQIKTEFSGIGWDYLGLQARMEYQQTYCAGISESATDEKFFQDKTVLTNLKLGYSHWKTEHVNFINTTLMYIPTSASSSSQQQQPPAEQNTIQSNEADAVPVSQTLPDFTLNMNILSMNLDDIESAYGSIDEDILGLQARMEYAKNKGTEYLVSESVHNVDIDFMFDEEIPQKIRSWYRKWLSKNQLVDRQGELFVVKLPNKSDILTTPVPSIN